MAQSLGNFTVDSDIVQPTWKSVNETAEYAVLSFVLFLLLLLFILVGHVCVKLWPKSTKREYSDQFSRTDNRGTSIRTDVAITLDTNSSIEIIEEDSSYYRCTGHTYMVKNTRLPLEDYDLELTDEYAVRTSDV